MASVVRISGEISISSTQTTHTYNRLHDSPVQLSSSLLNIEYNSLALSWLLVPHISDEECQEADLLGLWDPPGRPASMQKPRLGQKLHLVKNVSVTGAPRDPPDIIIAWRPHFSCHNNNKLKTREILKFLYLPLVNVFVMIIF